MVSFNRQSLGNYTIIFELVCIIIASTFLVVTVQCQSWHHIVRFVLTMLIEFGVMSYAIASGMLIGSKGNG